MKLIVYSAMPVIPPNFGGAIRIFNIVEKLSIKGIDVALLSPTHEKQNTEFCTEVDYAFFKPIMSKLCDKIKILSRIKQFMHFFIFYEQLAILKKLVNGSRDSTDIILQCEYIYSVVPMYVLKKMYGMPLIITEHNIESKLSLEINGNKMYYIILKHIEKFFLNKCDYIVCVSESDKKMLQNEYSIPDDKIVIGPNATNIPTVKQDTQEKISEIKKRFNIGGDTYIILFIGTLDYVPNKKAVDIIKEEIYPAVKSIIANVKFLIVGKGVKPKIDGDIIFTGVVDEIYPYIQMSDVAIAPLVQGGGTRLKILEYMAFSKPVVSTSKGAEGLEITNNNNILISDDWNNFSDKIIELLNNVEKRESIGKNARILVERKYTWDATCEKYIDMYKTIIREKHENK